MLKLLKDIKTEQVYIFWDFNISIFYEQFINKLRYVNE